MHHQVMQSRCKYSTKTVKGKVRGRRQRQVCQMLQKPSHPFSLGSTKTNRMCHTLFFTPRFFTLMQFLRLLLIYILCCKFFKTTLEVLLLPSTPRHRSITMAFAWLNILPLFFKILLNHFLHPYSLCLLTQERTILLWLFPSFWIDFNIDSTIETKANN